MACAAPIVLATDGVSLPTSDARQEETPTTTIAPTTSTVPHPLRGPRMAGRRRGRRSSATPTTLVAVVAKGVDVPMKAAPDGRVAAIPISGDAMGILGAPIGSSWRVVLARQASAQRPRSSWSPRCHSPSIAGPITTGRTTSPPPPAPTTTGPTTTGPTTTGSPSHRPHHHRRPPPPAPPPPAHRHPAPPPPAHHHHQLLPACDAHRRPA